MASIAWEGENGDLASIRFRNAAGQQQSLRLGKCSKRGAKNALAGFERVLEAHRVGTTIHPDGIAWLEKIDDRIHARVVALGLVEPRKAAVVVTLGELLARFDAAATVKPGTRTTYRQAFAMLRDHFGAATPLGELTAAGADGWRKSIAEPKANPEDKDAPAKTLATATVAKRVRVAKAVFAKAVKWGLMRSNPFADLRGGSQCNADRAFYVSREAIRAILDECPDREWRAIVALSRYAGLRCPSEIVVLRWGDVDWARRALTVRSAKTAGHEGHAVRLVPIADQLFPILQDLFDHAEDGAEAIVPRLRDPKVNLRTTFERIIARAGLTAWPRLFHNLRASCATDWVDEYPNHVVAGWLGHSPMIAAKHYLQRRDAHFAKATGLDKAATKTATDTRPSAPTRGQVGDAAERMDSQKPLNPAELVGVGAECDSVQNENAPAEAGAMTPWGFEPQFLG